MDKIEKLMGEKVELERSASKGSGGGNTAELQDTIDELSEELDRITEEAAIRMEETEMAMKEMQEGYVKYEA